MCIIIRKILSIPYNPLHGPDERRSSPSRSDFQYILSPLLPTFFACFVSFRSVEGMEWGKYLRRKCCLLAHRSSEPHPFEAPLLIWYNFYFQYSPWQETGTLRVQKITNIYYFTCSNNNLVGLALFLWGHHGPYCELLGRIVDIP